MPHAAPPSVTDSRSRSSLWKALGPGILVAAAAVGGSHLVWSTRAGALYGWSLLGLVLLANVLKFPFFLYGQRYTAATGESLLDGYKRQGSPYVWTFFAINVLTGTINIAAVAMLTGALLSGYGLDASVSVLTVGTLVICALLVLVGRYAVLDTLAKLVIALLTVGTVLAVALAVGSADPAAVVEVAQGPSVWTWASFGFLVSLLGWMPMPVDLSAWSSLWMFERREQTGHMATVRESSIDFYVGYGAAVVLAVLFLSLGALVMHPTGQTFSAGGVGFSNEFVALYTQTIGDWSRPLILTAAFVTMFSTTMTCVDGYPRSLAACCTLLFPIDRAEFATHPSSVGVGFGRRRHCHRADADEQSARPADVRRHRVFRHLACSGVDQPARDARRKRPHRRPSRLAFARNQLGRTRVLLADDARLSLHADCLTPCLPDSSSRALRC